MIQAQTHAPYAPFTAEQARVGKDLAAFSLETVHMFHDDARAAGYTIPTTPGAYRMATPEPAR